jgi:hypothetical protein
MQHVPVASVEASLAEPDPLEAAPRGAVAVRLTVRNLGTRSLRVRSNQTELELADGRRLETSRPSRPPVEAPTATAPAAEESTTSTAPRDQAAPTSPTPQPSSTQPPPEEPSAPASRSETAKKAAVLAVAVGVAVLTPLVVAAGIATSPIWGPFVLVAIHEERARLRAALDASLQAGEVALAAGEAASAVLEFVDAGVAGAGAGTAFVVLRVTDDAGRDWTARLRVVSPK